MTAKMTAKTYKTKRESIESELRDVTARLGFLKSKAFGELTAAELAEWNPLYDKQDDLERDLVDLRAEWDRRNWTGQDYQLATLIAQNID